MARQDGGTRGRVPSWPAVSRPSGAQPQFAAIPTGAPAMGAVSSYESLVHAVAGAVGSVTAMTVFFPLDTARLRLQGNVKIEGIINSMSPVALYLMLCLDCRVFVDKKPMERPDCEACSVDSGRMPSECWATSTLPPG